MDGERETETETQAEIVSVQGVKETQKDKLGAQTRGVTREVILVQCCHHHCTGLAIPPYPFVFSAES